MIHFIAEKRKWTFTAYEKLVAGALLWNFLLVAPSIVVGFFSNHLNILFKIYTLFSLSSLGLFLIYVLRKKRWRTLLNIKLFGLGFKVYGLPILLFALIVLFFHTFFLEYDAIYVFFPYAKSIAVTGSMKYNIYDQSTFSTGIPPVLPVIYGWAFTAINDLNAIGIRNNFSWQDLFRPIPAAYFLLTGLVIYLIARETLQKKHAYLSVIIFMSFPSTVLTISAYAYYFDLGFVFYLVSTMLCLTKALRTRKPIWFFLTGVASSLLLLAKELSIFIIPLVFATFVLFSSIKYRRVIFVMLSTLPFFTLTILDLYNFPTADREWILIRQLPVFALSAILYYLSKIEKKNNFLTLKNLFLFLVPFITSAVFFLRGITLLGSLYSIFSWGPEYQTAAGLFYNATGISRSKEVTSFLRWDIPFLSLSLGVLYLIPIILSIVYLSKRKHQGDKPVNPLMLMMFFTLLEAISFTSVGSQAETRRMYYFTPLMAIFAANGLVIFDNFLGTRCFIYLCTLFNSLTISYIWLYRFPFHTMQELSHLKTSLGLANSLDLAFLLPLFMGVFLLLPIAQRKLHSQFLHTLRVRFFMRRRMIYLSSFTLSFLLVVYPTIPIWLQGVDEGFLGSRYDVHAPTWENGVLLVSHYYNTYIDDDYVTVSFGSHALRYFANRSLIDLTTLRGVQSMQSILTINVSRDLLQSLNNSNIRYFLIPRSDNSFYDIYLGFQESFYLFELIEQNEHFYLIEEFDYYKLVKFEYAS